MSDEDIEELYQKTYSRVLLKLPEAEPDDIVQDTVIEAWRHRDQLRHESSYNAWVATIARKHIAEFYRQRQRRAAVFETDIEKLGRLICAMRLMRHYSYTWEELNTDEYFGVMKTEEQDHTALIWNDLMENLPAHYQQILCLYIMDGYTMPEIAKMLGKNYTEAWSLYRRAKAMLREVYMKD